MTAGEAALFAASLALGLSLADAGAVTGTASGGRITWRMGDRGESCSVACSRNSETCLNDYWPTTALHMGRILMATGGVCEEIVKDDAKTFAPAYAPAATTTCYYRTTNAGSDHCAAAPQEHAERNWQRFCPCQAAVAQTGRLWSLPEEVNLGGSAFPAALALPAAFAGLFVTSALVLAWRRGAGGEWLIRQPIPADE